MLTDLEVYYFDCTKRGDLEGASLYSHQCTKGPNWPDHPCRFRWSLLGEHWQECYVVSATGQPIEKWRCIRKYPVFKLREGSTIWELVWKSPFSNSSRKDLPCVPKGGHMKFADFDTVNEYLIRCKVEDGKFSLPFWADCRIKRAFESL